MAKAKTPEKEDRLRLAFDAHRMGGYYRMSPEELVIQGLDTKAGKDHPLYDLTSRHQIDEALLADIMANGVRDAVKVRKDGDKAELIDGRRRVIHAREANKRLAKRGQDPILIPVHVVKVASDKDATLLMMSSNSFSLAEDPVDRAEKAAKAIARGATEEEVGLALGVDAPAVKNILRLCDCSEKVKQAVREGVIPTTSAIKMSELVRSEQDELLEALRSQGDRITVKQTGAAVAEKIAEKLAAEAPAPAKKGRGKADSDGSDEEVVDGRRISRGASANFAPGRKELREALEIMRGVKTEYHKGFVQALRYALGEDVPTQLTSQRELAAAEAEAEAKKAADKKKAKK